MPAMFHAASQTWTLARLLPLMIGYCVHENDDYWKHFTMLLEILRYVLAPEILHDEVGMLSVLIVDFLSEFVQLYPQASVIPKMVHIPRLILK